MPRTNYSLTEYLRDLCILNESETRGVNIYPFKDTRSKLEILVESGVTYLRVGRGIDLSAISSDDHAGKIHNAWSFYKERPKQYRDPLQRKSGENDARYLGRLQTTNKIIENLINGLTNRSECSDEVRRLQNAFNTNNGRIAELLPTELNEPVEVNKPIVEPGIQGVLFEGLSPKSIAHSEAIKGGHYEKRRFEQRVGKRKLKAGL